MRIDRVIANNPGTIDLKGFDIDYIEVEWYEVSKKILHKVSKKGIDVGLKLDMENVLKHGDVLWLEGNKALVVEIPRCECIAVKPETPVMLGKACYEIGNRHAPLFYQNGELLMPYDEPTLLALKKFGLKAYKTTARLVSQLGGQGSSGHSHSNHSQSHENTEKHLHVHPAGNAGYMEEHGHFHSSLHTHEDR